MNRLSFLSLIVASMLYAQESVQIEHFQIMGNKKLDTKVLLEALTDYKGKALGSIEIQQVAQEITQKYRKLGYERERAYIPEQTVSNNTLKIVVTIEKKTQENELTSVKIEGKKLMASSENSEKNNLTVIEANAPESLPLVQMKDESIEKYLTSKVAVSKADISQDVFIQNLINEAIQKSPAVLSKDSAFQAALSTEDGAKWQYFPTPTISTEQGESGQNVTIAKIQQPLWAGGRIDAEYDKAKKLADVAKMSLEEMRQSLALFTCEALYGVISSYGHVLVYQDAVSRLEKHKEMIVRRVNQGISPDSELLLLNTRLVQAKTDLSMAHASQEKALALLSQRLTRSISIDELKPILPRATGSVDLPSEYENSQFIEAVLASHPGIERYKKQVESAGHEVEIKKASLMPTVYAKVEKQWDSTKDEDTKTSFVLGVQYTPGAGFSMLSAVETARANLLATQQEKDNFQLELKQKVSSELSDYSFTVKRYQNYLMAADTTQKTAASYDRLFIAGKRSWLDVLNAEREWSSAQISLSDVQAYLITMPMKLKIYASELEWQKGYK